ncbi:aldehyde dehydrogenase (NADP(+)) [Bordetella genomosp. 1]|uniref:Aldehyde dehydrogenase (NADP(+)) n=1 Tax=Bordetella genomosp. 1 TaxID=1395607 RepID=A0ABX4EY95_9BORD|nr:aldehyde dehydrogenase (NADP(+)) [Bordetella genomosp. 1]OZI64048.1 aldehyde dehydrogenase (NADP(+)) [Bordetella genomosp. 1]
MPLTGSMLIGAQAVTGSGPALHAIDPARRAKLEPGYPAGTRDDVARAAELARDAFDRYRAAPLETRAQFLETIAEEILAIGDELIERAHQETGLPVARLQGERGRTVGQLRLFARVVRDGYFLDATVDPALPERQPLPRPDLRLANVPLGPVAVFGASNFPLAFSVAGGDTASALAAGCPVIVKAHNAHPGTAELVGRAVQKAVAKHKLPEGTFSLLYGAGAEIGTALVEHPAIKAVGFTGSRRGGLALVAAANARHEPIPVYAEMASINPVFVMPAALAARGESIAQGFVDSLVMGVGQFCTNPGLVIGVAGPDLERFSAAAGKAVAAKGAATMLTPGIYAAYEEGEAALAKHAKVSTVGRGEASKPEACAAGAVVFATTAEEFLAHDELEAEVFGPASLIVACKDLDQVQAVAEHLEGQLTATLFVDDADVAATRALLPVLERKAGRILANGYPTGVEVSHAMVHGGPFPATSNAATTSVGATAIRRFLRPVCYQNLPDALLPQSVQAANPLGLPRMVDGVLEA